MKIFVHVYRLNLFACVQMKYIFLLRLRTTHLKFVRFTPTDSLTLRQAVALLLADVCWRVLTYADTFACADAASVHMSPVRDRQSYTASSYRSSPLGERDTSASSFTPWSPRSAHTRFFLEGRQQCACARVLCRLFSPLSASLCAHPHCHVDVCWRMLTYADVCWRNTDPQMSRQDADAQRELTYADGIRMLTYAAVSIRRCRVKMRDAQREQHWTNAMSEQHWTDGH